MKIIDRRIQLQSVEYRKYNGHWGVLWVSSGQPGTERASPGVRLHEDDVLRFTFNPDAPFTNNGAERAIRICKVKQNLVFRQECKTTLGRE